MSPTGSDHHVLRRSIPEDPHKRRHDPRLHRRADPARRRRKHRLSGRRPIGSTARGRAQAHDGDVPATRSPVDNPTSVPDRTDRTNPRTRAVRIARIQDGAIRFLLDLAKLGAWQGVVEVEVERPLVAETNALHHCTRRVVDGHRLSEQPLSTLSEEAFQQCACRLGRVALPPAGLRNRHPISNSSGSALAVAPTQPTKSPHERSNTSHRVPLL